MLPAPIVMQVAAAFIAINLGFYAVIRSGLNLRAEDPSLTRFQMMASITVLMYIVYHMDHGVINLLMHWRPEAIHDVPSEWMSWLGLAGFLPCFVIIGAQISALRGRMREREARSLGLAEMSSDFYWETDAGPLCAGTAGVSGHLPANPQASGRRAALPRGQAHHDSLTGLPNRLLFNDRLAQTIGLAKRGSRPFALLFLDLDRFKPVNDALGHTAGDELLKAVATRIREQVRESDTVARVGGDEFTVILPNIGRRDAEILATKIGAALATPFLLAGCNESVEIGTSVGIAIYPDDATDADALVTAADAAMYRAKQAGTRVLSHAA